MKKTISINQPQVEILRRAVLFSLTCHRWSNRRQADQSQIEADCDKSKLNTTKRLIESEKLKLVDAHMNEIYNWCLARAMLSGVRRGVYFVKRDMIPTFEAKLEQARAELQPLLDELVAEYDACKEKAKLPADQGGLGALYNELDYPNHAALRSCFSLEHTWLALSVPEELPEEVSKRECEKLRQRFEEAQTEVTLALRAGFKTVVDNACRLLKGDKKFTEKTTGTFEKFFETFQARNLMDDAALNELVSEAKSTLRELKTKDLKTNAEMRDATRAKFESVAQSLEKLLVDRPKRVIELED